MSNQIGPGNLYKNVVPATAIPDLTANTDFGTFTAPMDGTATIMLTLPTASDVNLMLTLPTGQISAGAILSGESIPANQPQTFSFPVAKGFTYALQVTTAQTGNTILTAGVSLR